MHEWMPGPISQASKGVTSTIKESNEIDSNLPITERMKEGLEPGGKQWILKQTTLKWPEKRVGNREEK